MRVINTAVTCLEPIGSSDGQFSRCETARRRRVLWHSSLTYDTQQRVHATDTARVRRVRSCSHLLACVHTYCKTAFGVLIFGAQHTWVSHFFGKPKRANQNVADRSSSRRRCLSCCWFSGRCALRVPRNVDAILRRWIRDYSLCYHDMKSSVEEPSALSPLLPPAPKIIPPHSPNVAV